VTLLVKPFQPFCETRPVASEPPWAASALVAAEAGSGPSPITWVGTAILIAAGYRDTREDTNGLHH